ncbi:MAG: hypothetical protein ACTTH0_05690 [Eubacteriales bacterium]
MILEGTIKSDYFDVNDKDGMMFKYNKMRAVFEHNFSTIDNEELYNVIKSYLYYSTCLMYGYKKLKNFDNKSFIITFSKIMDELEKLFFKAYSSGSKPSKNNVTLWIKLLQELDEKSKEIHKMVNECVNMLLKQFGEDKKII